VQDSVNEALQRLKAMPPKPIAAKIVGMRDQTADRRVSYKELWEALVTVPWTGDASRTAISKKLSEVIKFSARNKLPILTALVVRHGPPRDWSEEAIVSICEEAKMLDFSVGRVPRAFVEQQAKKSEKITLADIERAVE